jgi:hypothetical protein
MIMLTTGVIIKWFNELILYYLLLYNEIAICSNEITSNFAKDKKAAQEIPHGFRPYHQYLLIFFTRTPKEYKI